MTTTRRRLTLLGAVLCWMVAGWLILPMVVPTALAQTNAQIQNLLNQLRSGAISLGAMKFTAGAGTQTVHPEGTLYWENPAVSTSAGSTVWVTSTAYAIPANTLNVAGDRLILDVNVSWATAATDTKNIKCNIGYSSFSTSTGTFTGGQSIISHASATNQGTMSWWAQAEITRLSSATAAGLHDWTVWEGQTTTQSGAYASVSTITWSSANNLLCAIGNSTASNTQVGTLNEVRLYVQPR